MNGGGGEESLAWGRFLLVSNRPEVDGTGGGLNEIVFWPPFLPGLLLPTLISAMAVQETMITFCWAPFIRDRLPNENSMIIHKLNVIGKLLIQPGIDEQTSVLEISLVHGMLIRSQGHPQYASKLAQALETPVLEIKSR